MLESGFGKGIAFLEEGFGAVGVELLVVLSHIVFCKVAFLGYQVRQLLVEYMDAQGVAQVFSNLAAAGACLGGYGYHQPLAFLGLELGKVYKFPFVLEIVVCEKQLAYEDLGDRTYQEHCYQGSFPHCLEGAEEPEGEGDCDGGHGGVTHQLADTELFIGHVCHGLGKGLGREHDHVGYDLAAGTEGPEYTAYNDP